MDGSNEGMGPAADVLVIGAGVAGLAAAVELSRAGRRVEVIEARARLGGRVFTERVSNHPLPIELGAEFIHGRPPASMALAEQAGLLRYATTGEHWLARDGRLVPGDLLWQQADQLFAQMALPDATDRSVQSLLDRFLADPATREAALLAASYVEGFDAADPRRMSARAFLDERQESEDAGGESFRIADGYDRLVAALANGMDRSLVVVRLGTVARRVVWRPGRVEIEAVDAQGNVVGWRAAGRALITVPLGVLQAPAAAQGSITFTPALDAHLDAARRLAMGQVMRLTLRFRERFWERLPLADPALDPRQLSFLHGRDTPFPTWWTAYPALAPQLTAWAGGPAAADLVDLAEDVLVDRAMETLARYLAIQRERLDDLLLGAHIHNWHADPFARGAYSYVPVGQTEAVHRLAAPVEDTLFFAGEATSTDGNTGTVHGALITGRRAAREILHEA